MADKEYPELDEIDELEDEIEEFEEELPNIALGGPNMSPMGGGGGYMPLGNGGSEMAKAYSSYQTFLMTKTGATWTKLIDIRDFPDVHGDPNMLDTTTLSDGEESQTPGIKKASDKKFRALYTEDDYVALKNLEDSGTALDVAIWFGASEVGVPDGNQGKFEGKGLLTVKVLGKGVDEVREMELSFAMEEAFAYVS